MSRPAPLAISCRPREQPGAGLGWGTLQAGFPMTFRFKLLHPVLALEEHLAGATEIKPEPDLDSKTGDPTIPLVYVNLGRKLYIPQKTRQEVLGRPLQHGDLH